ncbi:MAG: hypothetical protein SGJ02_13805 [bacterium]|nr:hypothetical protein [bacterium]
MKNPIRELFLVTSIFLSFSAVAQPNPKVDATIVKDSMRGIYSSYKDLQPFILSRNVFFDKKNQPKILELVTSLQSGFHTIDKVDKKFHSEPGFATNILIVHETLTQVIKDLRRGSTEYDLRLLKGITQNCSTCHSTYNPDLNFHDTLPKELQENPAAKAQFLMATRQFQEAEKAFLTAAKINKDTGDSLKNLRQWLVIQTRINDQPDDALTKLQEFQKNNKVLYSYENEEIEDWIKSLKSWKNDSLKLSAFAKAKILLRTPLSSPEPIYASVHAVDLLRASGMLHRGLSDRSIKGIERGESFYMLGYIYSKLPLFFIDELPEIYFEQCIRENPNSEVARSAHAIYKDLIILNYTGSGGTHVPGDQLAKVDDLYRIAFGIPAVPNRL